MAAASSERKKPILKTPKGSNNRNNANTTTATIKIKPISLIPRICNPVNMSNTPTGILPLKKIKRTASFSGELSGARSGRGGGKSMKSARRISLQGVIITR